MPMQTSAGSQSRNHQGQASHNRKHKHRREESIHTPYKALHYVGFMINIIMKTSRLMVHFWFCPISSSAPATRIPFPVPQNAHDANPPRALITWCVCPPEKKKNRQQCFLCGESKGRDARGLWRAPSSCCPTG